MKLRQLDTYGMVPDIIATACSNSIKLKDVEFRVPCGKCLNCKKKRRSDWSLRLEHEWMYSDSAFFITLTYNDPSIPRNKGVPTLNRGIATLNKKDLQDYIKRLRNSHVAYVSRELGISKSEVKNRSKAIRYYAVGEYGSKTNRPHYHILLFNYDIANLKPIEAQWKNTQTGHPLGFVDIGKVSSASINYTTKYMFKQWGKKDLRERPFTNMSRRPMIGTGFLNEYKNYLREFELTTIRDKKGTLRKLPKAYLYKIYTMLEDGKEVKDKEWIRRLSEESYNKHIDQKLKEHKENLLINYNGDVNQWMQSKDLDNHRKQKEIINNETL
jgi:hypothetical protein